MALRNYSNVAPPQNLTAGLAAGTGATTVSVASTTGYPTPPFILGLDRGLSNQEVCLCTGISSTTFTVTRAYDGTPSPQHFIGGTVEHTGAAIDYREANAFVNTLTTLGDLMIFGSSGTTRLPAPSGSTSGVGIALMADSSQANLMAWEQVIPSGVVVPTANAAASPGFLMCLGQAVSRTTYANLWNALGTTASPWGQGDGSTTFNLPNLQGQVLIGVGTGTGPGSVTLTTRSLGTKYGEETHTLVLTETPVHGHTININDPSHGHTVGGGLAGDRVAISYTSGPYGTASGEVDVTFTSIDNNYTGISASATNVGSGGAHNNIQPSTGLNFMIKT